MISPFGLTGALIQIRPGTPPLFLFPFCAHSFITQRYYVALPRHCDALNSARNALRSGGPNNNESDLGSTTRARLICYIAVASIRVCELMADRPSAWILRSRQLRVPRNARYFSRRTFTLTSSDCKLRAGEPFYGRRRLLSRRPPIKTRSAFKPVAIDF